MDSVKMRVEAADTSTKDDAKLQEQILNIVTQYPPDRRFALAAMQNLQRELNYIPRQGLVALANHMQCHLAEFYAMATFYKSLSLNPKGRHIIKVCDGTACHIRGASTLITGIERSLGIAPGETSADGEFSLELVSCLGTCAIAPVMMVDGQYYGKLTMERLPDIFASILDKAADESDLAPSNTAAPAEVSPAEGSKQ